MSEAGNNLDWISRFEELGALPAADRSFIESHARVVQLGPEKKVFAPGMKPDAFLLLLDGKVRVQQVGAGGREIILYRVSGGESCIMTTACLLSDEEYLAEGITETDVTAVALVRSDFDHLIAHSPAFRRLVFNKYASRITRLMALVEDVAFQRIDTRLARKLLELSRGDGVIDITHHALAVELGTAREVISRQIKRFMAEGLINTSRGHIEITDRERLENFAHQA
ncbi:MAG: Crp/Fnr family transcriptional regulator [Gammaproteobacteria bacterium]|nr:Crp/Fnr family transcriptional regulator [Gammaproteobacteria bacterium]